MMAKRALGPEPRETRHRRGGMGVFILGLLGKWNERSLREGRREREW
jgi:hypothetical protein